MSMLFKASTLFFTVFLSGCASMFSRSSYPVSIQSFPAGAGVVVYDRNKVEVFTGTTPSTVKLKAGQGGKPQQYLFKFEKENFYPSVEALVADEDKVAFLSNFAFGWLGQAIDSFTGAKWSLERNVTAKLTPLDQQISKEQINKINRLLGITTE